MLFLKAIEEANATTRIPSHFGTGTASHSRAVGESKPVTTRIPSHLGTGSISHFRAVGESKPVSNLAVEEEVFVFSMFYMNLYIFLRSSLIWFLFSKFYRLSKSIFMMIWICCLKPINMICLAVLIKVLLAASVKKKQIIIPVRRKENWSRESYFFLLYMQWLELHILEDSINVFRVECVKKEGNFVITLQGSDRRVSKIPDGSDLSTNTQLKTRRQRNGNPSCFFNIFYSIFFRDIFKYFFSNWFYLKF